MYGMHYINNRSDSGGGSAPSPADFDEPASQDNFNESVPATPPDTPSNKETGSKDDRVATPGTRTAFTNTEKDSYPNTLMVNTGLNDKSGSQIIIDVQYNTKTPAPKFGEDKQEISGDENNASCLRGHSVSNINSDSMIKAQMYQISSLEFHQQIISSVQSSQENQGDQYAIRWFGLIMHMAGLPTFYNVVGTLKHWRNSRISNSVMLTMMRAHLMDYPDLCEGFEHVFRITMAHITAKNISTRFAGFQSEESKLNNEAVLSRLIPDNGDSKDAE